MIEPVDYLPLFAPLLEIARVGDPEVAAYCPFHNDQNPSLSFNRRNGLWKCFAACGGGTARQFFERLGQPFPLDQSGNGANRLGPIVATYDYFDLAGVLRHQTVRYEPKDFRQRRPDGPDRWIWNLRGVDLLLYRLRELQGAEWVCIPEGEKGADRLRAEGLVATCSPMGAGKWRDEYAQQLKAAGVQCTAVFPDNDNAGRSHTETVAASCARAGLAVKIVPLPGLPVGGDVYDWFEMGRTVDELLQEIERAPWYVAGEATASPGPSPTSAWAAAEAAPEFILTTDPKVNFLDPEQRLLAREAVTELFSPRGLGKTHVGHAIAVSLAQVGHRVLLLDRDNGRREVRRRLTGWNAAAAPSFKILTRDKVPPLTDAEAWRAFPAGLYDVVIVDSLDSASEGIGEKDSAKPSRAIAPLLDLARRADGPAILVLGNTVRSGAHSRGSGVIEDRADLVYEVRDATNFKPTGGKPWWLELPPQDAASWGERAARRKRRERYRLAFVSTKFRLGEEPPPFVLEIDFTTEPWSLRDVTETVERAGATALREAEWAAQARNVEASQTLLTELQRRVAQGEEELTRTGAVQFLITAVDGLTRKAARQLLAAGNGDRWDLVTLANRPGPPMVVRLILDGPGAVAP
jgi:hypothetical protein